MLSPIELNHYRRKLKKTWNGVDFEKIKLFKKYRV